MGSTAASSETSAAATANTTSQPRNTPGNGIQSVASTSSILQPVVPASRDLHCQVQLIDIKRHLVRLDTYCSIQVLLTTRQCLPIDTYHSRHLCLPNNQFSAGHIVQPSGVAKQQPMSVGGQTPHSSGAADRQPVSSGGRIIQPSGVADQQPMPVGGRVVHNDPTVGRGPQSSGVPDRQPVSIGLTGRMPQPDVSTSGSLKSPTSRVHHHSTSSDQSFHSRPPSDQREQPVPQDSGHTNRWNPSEPPQVTRHLNNVTQQTGQQYSGLRPEERARLAAHESRMESRENRRVPSEHRDEHYEQRRMDERHRGGWYNETRFPRDARPGDSSESCFPRDSRASDSRSDWRHQHRPGRQWYDDEQRRDRHEYPVDERPRYEERRGERRFKEHWSRDRWRR
ncbi:uncharacterized protein LOC144666644 [Oculina patagonica]